MRYLAEPIKVRMTAVEKERMEEVIRLSKIDGVEPRYDNLSHFVRCAINHLVRVEEKHLRLRQPKAE